MAKRIKKKHKLYLLFVILIALSFAIAFVTLKIKKKNYDNNYVEPIRQELLFLENNDYNEVINDSYFYDDNVLSNKYLNKYNSKKYTITNPYIVTNPYSNNEESALIMFKTEKAEEITIIIKGQDENDVTYNFEKSTDHFLLVSGLYANYDNEIIIKDEKGNENKITIKINDKLDFNIENIINNYNNKGFYYFSNSYGIYAIDSYGKIRLHMNLKNVNNFEIINNNILISYQNEIKENMLALLDMSGRILKEFEFTNSVVNISKINNDFLVATSQDDGINNIIMEIDTSGNIVKNINLYDILKNYDENINNDIAYNIANIKYNDSDNSLLIYLNQKNSIVSINYDNLELNYIFGNKINWSLNFYSYILNYNDWNFSYPTSIHNFEINNNVLTLYSNDYNEYAETVSYTLRYKNSYAMSYNIDIENKLVSMVYKYGSNELFSYNYGKFIELSDDYKLINVGNHYNEIKYDSNITNYNDGNVSSYIYVMDNENNIVTEIKIDGISSDFETFNFEEFKNYDMNYQGSNVSYYDNNVEKLNVDFMKLLDKASSVSLVIKVINNRMLINNVDSIILVSKRGNGYQYTGNLIDMSKMLNGYYYIYVVIDGIIYTTGEYVNVY